MKKPFLTLLITLAIVFLISFSGYAMETIQTQPSSDGNFEASLIDTKVRREVLTIKIRIKNVTSKEKVSDIQYESVYYTDVMEKKKYYPLKDSDGKYLAGPKNGDSSGGYFHKKIQPDAQQIIWIKFPAPPSTTEAVDIIIPGILPFEEIAITR